MIYYFEGPLLSSRTVERPPFSSERRQYVAFSSYIEQIRFGHLFLCSNKSRNLI